MTLQLIDRSIPIQAFELYFPTDEEIDRFCTMRDDYARKCKAEPFTSRCVIALSVGSRAFRIPIPLLQSARDQRQPQLVEDRQKLMAFSRVISLLHPQTPNTWKGIARAFNRKHPCVINAAHKFGAKIAAAMEMQP